MVLIKTGQCEMREEGSVGKGVKKSNKKPTGLMKSTLKIKLN